jgi:hypothetical protein
MAAAENSLNGPFNSASVTGQKITITDAKTRRTNPFVIFILLMAPP